MPTKATTGFEPVNRAFAELCLTTWPRRHERNIIMIDHHIGKMFLHRSEKLATIQDMDEQNPSIPENDIDNEPWDASVPLPSNFDIDTALASVATLSDTIAAHNAEQNAAQLEAEAEQNAIATYVFDQPHLFDIVRGQPASVIPAISLMALGAWLTFASSTHSLPGVSTIIPIMLTGLGVNVLFYWLASGRWAIGALFSGLSLIMIGGSLFVINTQLEASSWPLLCITIGVAMGLTGILARGKGHSRYMGVGFVVIMAGLAAYSVTQDQLPQDLLDSVERGAPAILITVAVILLLPLLLRRQH